MKVCSFLPAATSMIYELGLDEMLCGVTFECHSDKPRIVRSHLEGKEYSSEEINEAIAKHIQEGKNLYYLEHDLLEEIAPDVIFTQHVCNVCQIGTAYVEEQIAKLDKRPQIIPLTPSSLPDVLDNALEIARVMGHEEAGLALLSRIQQRLTVVSDRLLENQAPKRRVMLLEWMKPLYNCGHWIPDQIALAGGVDHMSNPRGHSSVVSWEAVQEYDPEVFVIAPCGLPVERSLKEVGILEQLPGWYEMTAVRNREVYVVDADLFTQPSITLIDGVELLAALFHPSLFVQSVKKYVRL
jgi:iron complex transport system substrate-binding protein